MKLKKVGKRLFGSFLAICLIVTGMSTFVFADEPADIADTYEVDDVTYYKVNTDKFGTSSKNFYKDLLSTNSSVIGNKSAAEQWKKLGLKVWDKKTTMSNTFKNLVKSVETEEVKDGVYYAKPGNLFSADSIKLAEESVLSEVGSYSYDKEIPSRIKTDDLKEHGLYKDDSSTGLVFALPIYVTGFETRDGVFVQGSAQGAYVVYFSDFKVSPLLPEDKGTNYVSTVVKDKKIEGDSYASTIKNNTAADTSASQTLSSTASASVSSEINGSNSYTYGTTLHFGLEKEFTVVKASFEAEFSFSNEIQRGWSETSEHSEDKSVERSVSVDLPAYTGVMLKSSQREQEVKTRYNCPIAISYRVRIVEYNDFKGQIGSTESVYQNKVITDFNNDARADLMQRAVIDKTHVAADGIHWDDFDSDSEMQTLIGYMSSSVPMSSTAASFTEKLNTVEHSIDCLMPTLPLRTVQMTDQSDEVTLKAGDSMRVDNINLEGLNDRKSTYYGFDEKYGHWTIIDEEGNELTDGAIASLEKQPALGREVLKAVAPGKVFLKYVIDEDRYGTWDDAANCAKNSELEKTAIIEVNIEKADEGNGGKENNNNIKKDKAANTLAVKAKKVKVKFKKLKKKAKKINVVTLTNKGQGALTYQIAGVKKAKFKKYFKINKKTGKLTIKKKLKKGTYKVKVKVLAAGNNTNKPIAKTVTVKIKVK